MPDSNEPRIIIDDDWKQQAQREKEEADLRTREQEEPQSLPVPSILELVQMVIMQASIGLGGMQDPGTGQMIPQNLPLAKHYIDLLEVLKNKTKGNLDEEETKIIDGTLHELRMVFVQIVTELGQAGRQPPPAAPKA
jgi:hypothetical protein